MRQSIIIMTMTTITTMMKSMNAVVTDIITTKTTNTITTMMKSTSAAVMDIITTTTTNTITTMMKSKNAVVTDFDEMGVETAHRFSRGQLEQALAGLMDSEQCGQVLRAKGFVAGTEGEWYEFDYIPGEPEVRAAGEAETTGVICVIGVGLKKDNIKELFGI